VTLSLRTPARAGRTAASVVPTVVMIPGQIRTSLNIHPASGSRHMSAPRLGSLSWPVGAGNLCHQAILVNHASSTVTPPARSSDAADSIPGSGPNPDASGLEDGVERGGEAGVPVVQDELCPCPGVFQVHEQVPGLLHYPRLDRMLGGSEDPDAAGAVFDDGKDVDLRAV